MKKKLLTLLTLALTVCSGAWAADGDVVYTQPSSTLDLMASNLSTTLSNSTWKSRNENRQSTPYTLTDDYFTIPINVLAYSTSNNTWITQCNAQGNANSVSWTAKTPFGAYDTYFTDGTNNVIKQTTSRMVAVKVTSCSAAYLYAAKNVILNVYEVTDESVAYNTLTKTGSKTTSSESVVSVTDLDPSKTYIVQSIGSTSSNANGYLLGFKRQSSTAPTISVSPSAITLTATESDVEVSKTFTITGQHLTDGTYNLTIPSVDGLSVSPTSFTVSEGSVSQVVTVSYSSTVNVPASSANITATVGDLNFSVAVNYSASVVAWTLQSISTSKTWDFDTKVTSSLGTTELKYENDDATTEHVYANIPELSFTEPFDATALAFTGVYPFRASNKRFAQQGTLRFNTTVPGKLVVKFSDTGSKASETAVKRYLVVNGEQTEYWTSRANNGEEPFDAQLNVTSGAIPVPAGDVTITGSSAIIISYVEFTAMPASVSGTITASGYNTYSSNYPLDLSTISGGTAYVATSVTDGKVVLTKCTDKVPAATGLFIAGTADEAFTIGTTAEATAAPAANLFVGRPSGGEVAKAADGQYNYVFGWTEVTNPGFYLVNETAATLASFKAYLHTTDALSAPAGARLAIVFDDDVTTGVTEIVNSKLSNSKYFDLQGRRVVAPQKGLYIVNGKKVVIK